jgi:hypothetical protein
MTEHWLHTDEKADLVASLAFLEVALNQATKDITAWKWVVIATHSALQSAIACHLGSIGNSFLVAKQEDAEAWLTAHDDGTPYPEMMMDTFPNLYYKLKHQEIYGYKFTPQGTQGKSIKKINEYRNEFVHFMPKGWAFEVSGLPDMCKDCLDVINELNEHTLHMLWQDDFQRSSFGILLTSCLEKLKVLKTGYDG